MGPVWEIAICYTLNDLFLGAHNTTSFTRVDHYPPQQLSNRPTHALHPVVGGRHVSNFTQLSTHHLCSSANSFIILRGPVMCCPYPPLSHFCRRQLRVCIWSIHAVLLIACSRTVGVKTEGQWSVINKVKSEWTRNDTRFEVLDDLQDEGANSFCNKTRLIDIQSICRPFTLVSVWMWIYCAAWKQFSKYWIVRVALILFAVLFFIWNLSMGYLWLFKHQGCCTLCGCK